MENYVRQRTYGANGATYDRASGHLQRAALPELLLSLLKNEKKQ